MHIPGWPPDINEWLPPRPGAGPPLPMWMLNPKVSWLPWEEREKIARKYGHYTARRAEAYVPENAGVQAVEAQAKLMYDRIKGTMGLPPPGRTGPKGPRVKVAEREEGEEEEGEEGEEQEPKGKLIPITDIFKSELVTMLNEQIVNSISQQLSIKPNQLIRDIKGFAADTGYSVTVEDTEMILSRAIGALSKDQKTKYRKLIEAA